MRWSRKALTSRRSSGPLTNFICSYRKARLGRAFCFRHATRSERTIPPCLSAIPRRHAASSSSLAMKPVSSARTPSTPNICCSVWSRRQSPRASVLSCIARVWRSFAPSDRAADGERLSGTAAPRYYGKYRGVVLNNADPLQLGRLLAKVPAIGPTELGWANPCVPYPAAELPTLAVPPVGTSVWMEFEGGDLSSPIWSGCFWAAGQPPLLKLP